MKARFIKEEEAMPQVDQSIHEFTPTGVHPSARERGNLDGTCRAAVVVLLATLSSCGSSLFNEQRGDAYSVDEGSYWMELDATRRSAFLMRDETGTRVLSEPAPDAALNRDSELFSKLVAKFAESGDVDVSAEGRLRVIETVAELSNRQESVLVLREALYRISELAFNGYLDGKEAPLEFMQIGDDTFSFVSSPARTANEVPEVSHRSARVERMFARTLDAIENAFGKEEPTSRAPTNDSTRSTSHAQLAVDRLSIPAGARTTVRIKVKRKSLSPARLGVEVTGAKVVNDSLPSGIAHANGEPFFGLVLNEGIDEIDLDLELETSPAGGYVFLSVWYDGTREGVPLLLQINR